MNYLEWIVCERTSRWASALRVALAARELPYRLREARFLAELDAELLARPTAVAAIEVRRDNFAELLGWLPAAARRHLHTHCVALLDSSLAADRDAVSDALVEAGVQALATSPRRLDAVIQLAARHVETAENTGENSPLVAELLASLPWQAE